jgi:Tfp pilus assembly protein PilN
MSKLRLDYQSNTITPWVGVCLAGVVAVMLIFIAMYFVQLRNQVNALEINLERTSSKKNAHSANEPSTEKGKSEQVLEIKNANEVLHHLSVPWDILFKAVESSGGSKITLLALEPDFEKKQVKISGEASNYSAVMTYIVQLQGQDVFDTVYLQNHDVRQEDPDRPVRFTLLANWREIL